MKWVLRSQTALLLGVVVLLAGCSGVSRAAQASDSPATQEQRIAVEVATAATGQMSEVLAYAGNLQARDSVKVVPLVSGRIASVPVQVGDVLKAGDVIAQVETDTLTAQVKQTEAALKAANLKVVKMKEGSRPEQLKAAEAAARAARTSLAAATSPTDDQRTVASANMAKAEAALRLAQHDYDKIAYAGQVGQTPQAIALEQATVSYQSAVAAYNLAVRPTDGTLAPLENAVAQSELNLALVKTPYTETDFEMAQAAVDQAKAAVDLAGTQLDNATIRAPFDGVVAEIYVSKGTLAGPSAPVVLFNSTANEASLDVEERRVGQIRKGQSASVRVSAFPGQDFPAQVTVVSPSADTKTHNFAVRVVPKDDRGVLRSGMYADVSILAQDKPDALLVPRAAVTLIDGQPVVYVVTDGAARLQQVTTGLVDDGRIEVTSGLKAGDVVVTAGQADLTDGAKVNIVKSAQAAS